MIIEQNIPASIRNWAYCLVEINRYTKVIRYLDNGDYFSLGTQGICSEFIRRYGVNKGREMYREKYCKPESARLKRRCSRYRLLADKIRQGSGTPPENRLLPIPEALSMIGSTLHYCRHGEDRYETLRECSSDGKQIYSSMHKFPDGLDPLTLLSLGFGTR